MNVLFIINPSIICPFLFLATVLVICIINSGVAIRSAKQTVMKPLMINSKPLFLPLTFSLKVCHTG